MQRLAPPFRVYVGLVATGYISPQAIDQVVRDGVRFCGVDAELSRLPIHSKVIVQPDIAMADSKVAPYGYTHPEFMRSVLSDLLSLTRADLTVLGRSYNGMPGSRILRRASGNSNAYKPRGYYEFEHLFPGRVKVAAADQCEHYRYQLAKGTIMPSASVVNANARASNEIIAPREYHQADLTVYCPKLKTSVLSQRFSGAIRLGDSIARGTQSDHHLCDMLEVCNPQLIITDGLVVGAGGNEVTQAGHELGLVLISNNALAHDWIAAQVFNIDPMKVAHLKIAAERGWGPSSVGQIELGGAGLEGVQNLAQKTRHWDLGCLRLEEFAPKFEHENSGKEFPLEILSGTPYESSGAHGMLLSWLYLSYDSPRRRARIAAWPRASVFIGEIAAYPKYRSVFAIGDQACRSLQRLYSHSRMITRLGRGGRLTIERAQLKNGKHHLIVKIAGSPPRLRDLVAGFAIASLGRMSPHLFTFQILGDLVVAAIRRIFHPPMDPHQLRLVLTSRMQQNAWWALRPAPRRMNETTARDL